MLSTLTFDRILSDPLLLVGTALLVIAPAVFLFSLIKYLTVKTKPRESFTIPVAPPAPLSSEPKPAPPTPQPAPPDTPRPSSTGLVTPKDIADVQGQIEVAISQLKFLNQKVSEIEGQMDTLERHASVRLESSELKEPPANAGDFSVKLLKLAEHVIVLEKEVTRLKLAEKNSGEPPLSSPSGESENPVKPKPPVMPL